MSPLRAAKGLPEIEYLPYLRSQRHNTQQLPHIHIVEIIKQTRKDNSLQKTHKIKEKKEVCVADDQFFGARLQGGGRDEELSDRLDYWRSENVSLISCHLM